MKLNPIQTVFRGMGLIASAASVWGTYGFMMHETSGDPLLSGAVAGGLSIAIYTGWDVLFNHKSWQRRALAGTVAVTFAAISTVTIYQLATLPTTLAAQAEHNEAKATAKIEVATQIATARAKAKADREAISTQQTEIRKSLSALKKADEKDQVRIDEKQANVDRGWHPKTNRREIKEIRADMDKRQTRATDLQQQLETLTEKYTAITVNPPTPVLATTAIETEAAALIIDPMTLTRAALYETLTMLFLLFGSFYRSNDDEVEAEQVAAITTATAKAESLIAQLQIIRSELEQQETTANHAIQSLNTTNLSAQETAEKTAELISEVDAERGEMAVLLEALQRQQNELPEVLKVASTESDLLTGSIETAKHLLSELQTTNVRCNKTIASANAPYAPANAGYAPANAPANVRTITPNEKLDDMDALNLLKNQEIEVSDKGHITTAIIKEATGWGRTKAENLINEAYEAGYLERAAYGRGWIYFYPAEAVEDQIEMPGLQLVQGGK